MKEYKLVSWPELPSAFQRTAYRRAMSNLSQRFMSAHQLAASAGLPRAEARQLIDELSSRGALIERERAFRERVRESWKPVEVWIRRQIDGPGRRY